MMPDFVVFLTTSRFDSYIPPMISTSTALLSEMYSLVISIAAFNRAGALERWNAGVSPTAGSPESETI